jgi:hypothetical protein
MTGWRLTSSMPAMMRSLSSCFEVTRMWRRRAYNAAEWMPDRRRMMQWWADHITAMALEGDNIVPLSRAS